MAGLGSLFSDTVLFSDEAPSFEFQWYTSSAGANTIYANSITSVPPINLHTNGILAASNVQAQVYTIAQNIRPADVSIRLECKFLTLVITLLIS